MQLPRYYFSDEFTKYENIFLENGKKLVFKKGDFLCKPGYSLDTVYYILDGLTNFSILHEDGNLVTPMFFGKGSLFPLICSTDGFALELSITLKACSDVQAIALTVPKMNDLLSIHSLSCDCIDHYCKFSNQLLARNMSLTFISSESRVADFLYLYSLNQKNDLNQIHLTQQEISSITGLSRAQLARILSDFRNHGIIRTHRRSLQITDMEKLLEFCSMIANP